MRMGLEDIAEDILHDAMFSVLRIDNQTKRTIAVVRARIRFVARDYVRDKWRVRAVLREKLDDIADTKKY